jgi:flagellar hook-length control protein FliK
MPESASSVAQGVSEQTPPKAGKTRFEKLLEEGKRKQADEQPNADARTTESQGVPAQTPAFHALGLFGGNPLPLEGQILPPGADTLTPEALVASPVSQSGSQSVLQEGANALIQAAQPVITGPGVDAPSTAVQTDAAIHSAAIAAAQSATSPDSLSAALAEVAGAGATAASAVLPEATVSVAAEAAQPVAEKTNAQVQAAEIVSQPDAAERARASLGISTLDPASGLLQGAGQGLAQGLSQGLSQAGRHEFSVNYTLAAGQGGQLQQFAEALRQAGGTAEAGPQSILQAAAQSGTNSAAAQTAERGASVFTASTPGAESQQAWRADSAAAGVTASGSRGAPGTLSFAQGMQTSKFGQPLGQSFGDSEWAESVTKRVALMAGQKVSSAQIELDPPELGALTVRVSVSGDQANVMFTSAHAQVREALQQSFTRLQDMLGQQGLQLADAQVSDQSAARQQQGEGRSGQGGGGVSADEGDAGPVTMQSLKVSKGLVDYYA